MSQATMSPDEALVKLMAGNRRYTSGAAAHPHQDTARRQEVLGGQQPFAIILSCSDSRVPPEVFFDQGIGDIFIIRDAGNIVDDVVLGSIEYAAEHLGVPLIVVLGHDKCGAVTATIQGGEAPGHIGSLVKAIAPAVEKARTQPGELLDNAIWQNVKDVAAAIAGDAPLLTHLIHQGKLKVVGARYHLDSGEVELLP
jgi:carbonic anhydrase